MITMVSPETVWGVVKMIHYHPRFRLGFLGLTGAAFVKYVLWNAFLYWRTQKRNQTRKQKADKRKQEVRSQCNDSKYEDILKKEIDDLLKSLKKGDLTAVQVLKAFQKKALQADDSLNCITEPIVEAMTQAKKLDQSSDKDNLLHGLPVSLKECIGLAGYDRTGGMSCFVDRIMFADAVVVKVLKKHGAIPFMRTNIPQTMMSYSSSNPIYGETSNPCDTSRAPGGSSSGEAALIGAGGSFIGIGSDVGGSIRVPAAFCGCYGLKTTNKRISYKGVLEIAKGRLAIQSNICPIAKDWKSLNLISKALMSEYMYEMDPRLPYMPFNQENVDKTGPMRIGYYVFDGNIRCQPPVVRAVMESKVALEKRGHTLIPIDLCAMAPPNFDPGQMFGIIIAADRFKKYKELLIHDKIEKSMRFGLTLTSCPPGILKLLGFITSFKDASTAHVLNAGVGFKSVIDYFKHIEKFKQWQDTFMESWLDKKLDAVICPVFPAPAARKDVISDLIPAGTYCHLYNSLDYPSGVLPVTKVTKKDIKDTKDPKVYKPTALIEKFLMKSVEGSEGLPVGIQCVALPFREETCLRVMREVESGL